MDMIEEVHHKPPLGKSHHSRLEFMYRCYHVQKINVRRKFMYDKGDYDRIRIEHGNIDWNAKLSGMNTQETWLTIEKYINDLCNKHIPTKAVHSTARRRRPVWMNDCMFRKLKKKSEAYSRYLQTKEGKDYQEYCKTRNQAKREVRRAKKCFEKQLGEQAKTNPKAFYNYCNLKRKTKAGIAGLKREDGTTAEDDQEKTEMLNNFFSSVYTKEDFANVPSMEPRNNGHYLDNITITEATVAKKLSQLNAAKSPGLDGIHPRILKELSSVLSKPITILYKRSLEEMKLPTEWKEALVTPIFKKGRKSSLENYRPVCLTAVLCKVLEKFVREALYTHMEEHLSECQHGFMKGRSCITQLLETLDMWTETLDKGGVIDAIYLDFAKAFDSVPHKRLLVKLEAYGIRGKALGWLGDFLHERRQRVSVNGAFSRWNKVASGIPQGSVLGPALFVCFINDMPEVVRCSSIKLFADDAKVFKAITEEESCTQLQADLNRLQEWANTWQLRFNASKCQSMHLGRGNTKHDYTMNPGSNLQTLEETTCEKDLGVYIDNVLKFSTHAERAANKGSQLVGMIRRSFDHLDGPLLAQLFKCFVRPHLEYGNTIWAPFYEKDTTLIENVQRRATKTIQGIRDLRYEDRLRHLKLPSLVYRRLRGDLIETYKMMNGHYNIDVNTLLPQGKNPTTRGHNFKLSKQRFNTDTRKRFFSLRVVNYWNALPDNIVEASTTNTFKNRLDKFYGDIKYKIDFPVPTPEPQH